MFDYRKDTRSFYKSDEVARNYHRSFTDGQGLAGFRSRFIARRERMAVRELLRSLDIKRVIDIPAGTGKMASVFRYYDLEVVACDISENMLAIARNTYNEIGPGKASFHIVDLESATEVLKERYDAIVCVRLLHRVPDEVKDRMLAQMSELAAYAVVSFGVNSRYHRVRAAVRRAVLADTDVGIETRPTRSAIRDMVSNHFNIVRDIPVAAGISAERMYLLNSKKI